MDMICMACSSGDTWVVRTEPNLETGLVMRRHECRTCEARWTSSQVYVAGSLRIGRQTSSGGGHPPAVEGETSSPGGLGGGGGLSSASDLTLPFSSGSPGNPDQTRARSKGKAKAHRYTYSPAFEEAWKAYGRHEEKLKAYGAWQIAARELGESVLLERVLAALKWQSREWAPEGWKYAPYFERYLKRRKWEDERPRLRVVGGDDLPDPADPANWEIPR